MANFGLRFRHVSISELPILATQHRAVMDYLPQAVLFAVASDSIMRYARISTETRFAGNRYLLTSAVLVGLLLFQRYSDFKLQSFPFGSRNTYQRTMLAVAGLTGIYKTAEFRNPKTRIVVQIGLILSVLRLINMPKYSELLLNQIAPALKASRKEENTDRPIYSFSPLRRKPTGTLR
ncbi:hypothetical protein EBR96_00400 [bacterium]|nr:hypothetical protein [bacterium]